MEKYEAIEMKVIVVAPENVIVTSYDIPKNEGNTSKIAIPLPDSN